MGLPNVKMYVDGSSFPNPGFGGWGAVIIFPAPGGGEVVKELYGPIARATNQRAELLAAINGLDGLKRPSHVELWSDSKYVVNGMTSWVWNWIKYDWKTSTGDEVKNQDLWDELIRASSRHEVVWRWVKGHVGDTYNEMADVLAGRGRAEAEDAAYDEYEAAGPDEGDTWGASGLPWDDDDIPW